ncbi:MAG: hypothetical protein AB7S75_11050 [Desulfococcaceae bacterium]
MMSMLLILVGVLGIGTVIWLILSRKSEEEDQEEIDDHYNCHICDDRDCECQRVEDSESTSQNSSDES